MHKLVRTIGTGFGICALVALLKPEWTDAATITAMVMLVGSLFVWCFSMLLPRPFPDYPDPEEELTALLKIEQLVKRHEADQLLDDGDLQRSRHRLLAAVQERQQLLKAG